MFHKVYFFILIFIPLLSSSQEVISKEGRFSVDLSRGCAPMTISINEIILFDGSNPQYDFGDDRLITTSTEHTYDSAGIYKIAQILGVDVSPKTDTLIIEVITPTSTNFSIEKCSLSGINITSKEETYDAIRVYFTPNDSATISFGESASFNYESTTTQIFQTKGLYNDAQENCTLFSHQVTPLNNLIAPQIINTSIIESCRDTYALTIVLDEFDSLINYQVELQQDNTSSIVHDGLITNSVFIVPDINYNEGSSSYCVSINALDNCTSSVVEGQEFCQPITPLTATPFEHTYSTYEENGISIILDSISGGSLLIYRKLDQDGDFELRNTVQNSFTDPLSTIQRAYFYQIDYQDTCGQILHSFTTNPPLITSEKTDDNTYMISFINPENALIEDFSNTYQIGEQTTSISSSPFELRLNSSNGSRQFLQAFSEYESGEILNSNQLAYRYTTLIHVPTAFTPNNDGINDHLELFGLPSSTITTNIYSRWGQLVHTAIDASIVWDGYINNQLAPEDTYVYELIFEDTDGQLVRQKGTFALLKK